MRVEGVKIAFAPLFFAFGLILLIGCANVGNLLLARGVSRQREIGIRLSLGASRPRIIRQLLTESVILALVAAACGLVLVRLFLDGAFYAVTTTVPPEIARVMSMLNVAAPTSDWRLLVFLVCGAIASTVFFGLAPALHTSRVDLVSTMRGEVTRGARPRRTRHLLLGAQVGASALLLICAGIFLRGASASAAKDPGVRTIDTLAINLDDEAQRGNVLQILRAHPLVALVAAESRVTRGAMQASESSTRVPVDQLAVSSDYFEILGYGVVNGRAFTPAERTADEGIVIVSDGVARQLWPNGSGVGQVVRLEQADAPDAKADARTLTVVGVVRNPKGASVYLPAGLETAKTGLTLRVRGNPEQARLDLVDRLPGLDPGFGVMSLRSVSQMQAYLLRIGFSITVMLGGLALVLTVSGLFAVLSVPRRATVERDRRTNGPGRRDDERCSAHTPAECSARRDRPDAWRRSGGGRRDGDPDDRPVVGDRRRRQRRRPCGLCRQPLDHRHVIHRGGGGSRSPRRSHRSHRDTEKRLTHHPRANAANAE